MANLKEVRERISSVISTQQITKAMKMVSAAKLRKAQQAITQMRPYADKLNSMLSNILSNLGSDVDSSFGVERDVQNALLVVVTSNRGLCGAFNTNVIKSAMHTMRTTYAAQHQAGKLTVMCIGKKGYDAFKRVQGIKVVADHQTLFTDLNFSNSSVVSQEIMDGFSNKGYDHVTVCYGRFKNAGTQFAEADQFLPVPKQVVEEGAAKSKKRADYEFEPGKQELLEHLIPSILHTKFYKYLLDTHASEHGARMTAMDKATENANDMLRNLRINYNKARQEAITKELSEIVGGAAALGG